MQLSYRSVLIVAFLALGALSSAAQQEPGEAPSKPAPYSKRFCSTEDGFCFAYPANWVVLGQAFDDGIVVAPKQSGDRALWDEVTVATIVPAPGDGQLSTSVEQVIDTATNNMRASGRNPATLQRQERTVDSLPAQMLKIRYHDEDSGRDWIEEVVLIEGPQQEVYSVALKAQPATLSTLEPAFAAILRSWKHSQPSDSSPAASSSKSRRPSAAAPLKR